MPQHRHPAVQTPRPQVSNLNRVSLLGGAAVASYASQNAEGAPMMGQLGSRVLLVDDEPQIRKLISTYLVAAGYVVQTAVDGLDALRKLRAGLPDLILSDRNIPRMSGLELLAVVRKRFPQIPVMVISSVAADEMPVEVAADAYFHKTGLGFDQLLETISALTRELPLRTAPPPSDNQPFQARCDGKGHYTIGCDDCLREFSVPRGFHMGRDEMWATCAHCGKMVQFLVVERPEGK
jgi:CheY-like chemotaxis protein